MQVFTIFPKTVVLSSILAAFACGGDGNGPGTPRSGGQASQGPVCGNSISEIGEECDDGNRNDGDSCNSMCRRGNSFQASRSCGDGTVDYTRGEEWDDGNVINGDGCSRFCLNDYGDTALHALPNAGSTNNQIRNNGQNNGFGGRNNGFDGRNNGFDDRNYGTGGRNNGFGGRNNGFDDRNYGTGGRCQDGYGGRDCRDAGGGILVPGQFDGGCVGNGGGCIGNGGGCIGNGGECIGNGGGCIGDGGPCGVPACDDGYRGGGFQFGIEIPFTSRGSSCRPRCRSKKSCR